MKLSLLRFLLPLAALAFVAPGSALAQKGKGDTGGGAAAGPIVIPGGPVADTYVISAPGAYVLGGNREMTDLHKVIIDIQAPDVSLDLGGHRLAFSGAATTTAVNAASSENIEVRNGTIANAECGVWLGEGEGIRLLDLRVVNCVSGIFSRADATQVERCFVSGSTSQGISLYYGLHGRITDCTVTMGGTTGGGINSGNRGTVTRVSVKGGETCVIVGHEASLLESHISGAGNNGVAALGQGLVQNCHITGNTSRAVLIYGSNVELIGNTLRQSGGIAAVVSTGESNILMNNRIRGAISGAYTNAGGNTFK